MDKVLAINTKGMREAKGMQMLKVKEITRSAKRPFRASHVSLMFGHLISPGMKRKPEDCNGDLEERSG